MLRNAMDLLRSVASVHRPSRFPNVFIFALPRGGSTWLMELIWSQPGFKTCNEPLDVRKLQIQKHLGINGWVDLYDRSSTPKLQRYFNRLCTGKLGFLNPLPLPGGFYRPITRRIVFKVIHGAEDRAGWLADSFNGRVTVLLRHPIAVSLSRQDYPNLEAFIASDYRRHFTPEQFRYARMLIDTGSKLQRGVLAWCLANKVLLREATSDWAVVSYEQLVLDPIPLLQHLAAKLDLPAPKRMIERLPVPSAVKGKSDEVTQELLEQRDSDQKRHRLVDKWRDQVSKSDEQMLLEILDRFELDTYRVGDVYPAERFRIPSAPSSAGSAALPSAAQGQSQ